MPEFLYSLQNSKQTKKKKLNKNTEEYPPCSNTKLVISELWIQSSLTFFFTSPMLCSFKLHDCSFHWLRMCDYYMQFCINILNSKAFNLKQYVYVQNISFQIDKLPPGGQKAPKGKFPIFFYGTHETWEHIYRQQIKQY